MASPRSLVIIPTFNEIENIPSLIPTVLGQDCGIEILIVDDGSPDGTGDLVQTMMETEPRIHMIRRACKMGLGSAYLAGFRWALERDYALIFEMDADFSHDPAALPQFLKEAEKADLVLGSRYNNRRLATKNWPLRRILLSYTANLYARIVTGMPISDATGGFKCFRREALLALDFDHIRSNGYCFQIETTYKIWKKKMRVVETPIVFTERIHGTSKISRGIIFEAIFKVIGLRFNKNK